MSRPDTDISTSGGASESARRREVMIYSRYERFWHWSQAALIFALLFTGLGLHGTHDLLDFKLAVQIHTYAAIALILLWLFTTFWNFTTGQWKQYMFKGGLWKVIRFYAYGILVGEPHPYKKSLQRKQNALQSLAYMTFMVIIGPALWLTGIVYLTYDLWNTAPWSAEALWAIALIHTIAAFAMGAFVIIHVYMTTTGKTIFHYVKTMITGYDRVELSEVEEAYIEQTGMVDMKK
ncbi:cytochrome b/b6 domain-containing protein [Roseospirillum parvum]|uniref:Thiosulfate reductase cytochrome b subunit n=1 Tax=Roseospirillum parvum TaxID=83401 RepID=A0A1G8DIL6_9PROT|nr:cytochrome b/b6 domain-containing protein [Roseospirillum parvum]SDH57507.1 Thiosulfate reductase cytochrome b subunit [Roseospirillum parvum]